MDWELVIGIACCIFIAGSVIALAVMIGKSMAESLEKGDTRNGKRSRKI